MSRQTTALEPEYLRSPAAQAPAVSAPAENTRKFQRIGNERLTIATVALGDVFAVLLGNVLFFWLDRLFPALGFGTTPPSFLAIAGISLALFAGAGLYPGVLLHPAEELRRICAAAALAALLSVGIESAGVGGGLRWYLNMACSWFAIATAVFIVRRTQRQLLGPRSWWGVPAIILGGERSGRAVVKRVCRRVTSGIKVAGWVDDDVMRYGADCAGPHVLGNFEEVLELAAQSRISHAVLVMGAIAREDSLVFVRQCRKHFRHLLVVPEVDGLPSASVESVDVAGVPCLLLRQGLLSEQAPYLKRLLDLVLGVIVGVCVLPVIAAICLAIRLTSEGPVFYKQERVGVGGKPFTLWKFRSMVLNADDLLQLAFATNPECRREWEANQKLRRDPRLTWIGRIIRKTSLDELPQIWNILRGSMSFVGPRPIVADETAKYGTYMFCYTQVRPGVTGLWQVSGRNNTSYAERVELDTFYVRNWSIWLDIYILAKTVRTVLTGEGAY